jgi:RND family efflux transporter MFP subunit
MMSDGEGRRSSGARALRLLLIAVVLLTGVAVSAYLIRTPPRAARVVPERQARLVDVVTVRLDSQPTLVAAMGTVGAARRIELRPQVSGEVVEVGGELVPGGRFAAGDVILRIDPSNYELAVRQRASELAEAEAALAIERGNQEVARREYELLGETILEGEEDLVLRQPQLRSAQARVASAGAALAAARLDLERTTVRAPFSALVEARFVELGAQVDPATVMASLVGTEEYWVEAAVPVSQLRWIEIPGAAARVYDEAAWGADVWRRGRVDRLYGDLESEGRMARILVAVADPLGKRVEDRAAPLLLLNSYVRVEVEGRTLDDVAAIDRRLLRDGDRVWIMRDDGALEIRPVSVAFRGPDRVLVSAGLSDGERLVVTDLPAAVEGMPLRVVEDESRG